MRKISKIICVLLAGTFLFAVGCNKNAQNGSSSTGNSSAEQPNNNEVIGDAIGTLCDGNSIGYDVVIPADAGDCLRYASEELVSFVKQSTGVTLQVKEDGEAVNNVLPYISLGDTLQLQQASLDVDYTPLETDGFVIESQGKNLFVTGNTERSVMYGVYDFLERFVGIKFLTYDYTYVPTLDKITLYETKIVEIPAFENRTYLSNQLMFNSQFAARMRMNNEYLSMSDKMPDKHGGKINQGVLEDDVHNTLYYMFGHTNTASYLSDPLYLEHQEWFYVNEKGVMMDLCYSHVGLTEDGKVDETLEESPIKIFIERLKGFVLRDTHANYFMIGQEDRIETCECSECIRQEALYGRSGMLVRFINAIAGEIASWQKEVGIDREINVVTFAYYFSERAPLNDQGKPYDETVIPAENVYIRIAPITAYGYFSMTDEKQRSSVRSLFNDWSKITDRFWIWTYHTCYGSYFVYYPTMHHWQEDFQLYASMDTAYVLLQSAYSENRMWTNHMETYVASKMLWDPNQSVEELKQEYIRYYYAGYDDLITEFIDNFDVQYAINILGNEVAESERPLATIGGQDLLMNHTLYSTAFWNRQFELLDLADERIDAMDLTDLEKNKLHERVATIRLTPQYMVAMRYDFYYSGDIFGKNEFLGAFFANCVELGVAEYREGGSVDGLKSLLGYTD